MTTSQDAVMLTGMIEKAGMTHSIVD